MFPHKKLVLSATLIVIVMLFSTNVVKSQVFDIFNTSATKLARVGIGDPTGIDVSITTDKQNSTLTYFSDSRLKDNIQAIPVSKVADLYKVNAVQYTSSSEILKEQRQRFEESSKDNLTPEQIDAMRLYFDSVITERNADTRIHYGVIAQDLDNVYPDLVYEDNQGYLSVDYTGLIPVMLEATKELNKEIKYVKEENEYLKFMLDSLLKRLDKCCPEPDTTNKQDTTTWRDTTNREDTTKWEDPPDTTNRKDTINWEDPKWQEPEWPEPLDTSKWGTPKPRPQKDGMLLGNAPNPFSDETVIGYEIPQGASTAFIVIYDADGNEIMRFDVIGSKGTSYLPVDGSYLKSGTYTYCLIVNGKKIECKQMVVVK